MEAKKICALTMVRNDDFFLRRWVRYYGSELGEENLYIFLDGKDQEIPQWCGKAHVTACDKIVGKVVEADRIRLRFLSEQASRLLADYDMAIGTDADEFVVVDPAIGLSLRDFLSQLEPRTCYSGLGIDVGQDTRTEGEISSEKSFLSQRKSGLLSTRYTKPSVITKPVTWGAGFHRVKGHDFHIEPGLFLFHFGYFDLKRIEARFQDKDRKAAGWGRHLAKRARTIRIVSRKKALDWEKWTKIGRLIQTFVRPPYAWNKPAMFNMSIVVRIPDRFNEIV